MTKLFAAPAAPAPATVAASAEERAVAVPWYIIAVLVASTSVFVGVQWDISWHRSIGRDTFWTPAHLAIYLGGLVAGLSCGWLVLKTTFAGSAVDRAHSVRFWRYFYGPLGAWVCIWGAFAMITSAPFDNWWHNAYGLDVEILSPPHVVLALGIDGIQLGALLMVLALQNRTTALTDWQPDQQRDRSTYRLLYAYAAGIWLIMVATMLTEYSFPNAWHQGRFVKIAAGTFPFVLVAFGRAGKLKWPATSAAAIYMGVMLLFIWIIQLFPATPSLAPIYNPITNMVPPHFPLVLVAPCIVIDLIMRWWGNRGDWLLTPLLAAAFVGIFSVVHWYFGEFLLSPAARHWFFGTDQWDYTARLGPWRYEFWRSHDTITFKALLIAALLAMLGTRLGLWWGNWMSRTKR